MIKVMLTIILPKQRRYAFAINIEPFQDTHPCNLNWFFTADWPKPNSHLDIPKRLMDSSKNGRWVTLFKKFIRLRIKINAIKRIVIHSYKIVSI